MDIGAKLLVIIAIASACSFAISLIHKVPLSIRSKTPEGELEMAGVFKSLIYLVLIVVACAHGLFVAFFPLLISAKIAFIELLIMGCIVCWIGILNSGNWAAQLVQLQSEFELATNLTFLQGEMVRAQLEDMSARIHKSMEPQEIDMTETLLQSLSPMAMLFFKKEKSIMKWSMAAVKVGKTLGKYFWSPKK